MINVIPQTTEKYLTFKVLFKQGGWSLKFIDWMAFQGKSLDALVKMLPKDKRTNLRTIAEGDPAKLELCLEKMPMLYEYITCLQVLEETKLPPEGQAWYSTLRDKQTSHKDVVHAQQIWNRFQCQTINDFLDVYLKVDVFGLRDVIAAFRERTKGIYGLDPLHFIGLPGFALQAALRQTGTVVKPYTADVYDTLFRGNTGGISHITVREATANNPECPNYNPELPTTWLVPWDMAALYGDTMGSSPFIRPGVY